MFDLTGKTALVTGASGGIGGAIVDALHAQGATVVLSGTKGDALARSVERLGSRAHAVARNLSDPAQVDTLIADVEKEVAPIDILVSNAGITRDNLFMRMNDAEWEDVLAVNLTATFKLARASLKGMMRRRWGRIIAVTSIVGAIGNAGQANYAASKAGTTGMIKCLAAEAAQRNVTANCIAPGFIETAMTDALNEKQKTALLAAIPSQKLGQPADVAGAAVFLASTEAAYITGQTIHVNGGMVML